MAAVVGLRVELRKRFCALAIGCLSRESFVHALSPIEGVFSTSVVADCSVFVLSVSHISQRCHVIVLLLGEAMRAFFFASVAKQSATHTASGRLVAHEPHCK